MEIKFKKFQNGGGFAPFLSMYQPLQSNAQSPDPTLAYLANINAQTQQEAMAKISGSSSTKTSSSKSTKQQSIEQTEKLLGDLKGLDNDVQQVVDVLEAQARQDAYTGIDNSTTNYYRTIKLVNKVIDSKEEYKETFNIAKNNKTLSEAAITADGQIVLQTNNGYTMASPDKAIKAVQSGKARICKNSDLLKDRRHNPNMAFNNELLSIVQNGVSFDSVKDNINSIASSIGNKELKYSGYTKAQQGKIESGLQALGEMAHGSEAGHTIDGVYKDTYQNKSNQQNIAYAIDAIYQSLTSPQIAYLQLHSDGTDKGAKSMLQQILMVRSTDSTSYDMALQKDLDLDGSKKSSNGGNGGKPISAPEHLINGDAYRQEIEIAPGTTFAFKGTARYSSLAADKIGNGSTLSDISKSGFAPILDLQNASMGGQLIKNLDQVMLKDSDIARIDLPCKVGKDGSIQPDFDKLHEAEDLNKVLVNEKIEDNADNAEKVNQVCKDMGMDPKYIKIHGQWQYNTKSYRPFAIMNATASEQAFAMDAPENFIKDTVAEGDDNVREWFKNTMKSRLKNKKYDIDGDLFNSQIFIPLRDDAVQATLAQGSSYSYKGNVTDITEAEALTQANQEFMQKKDSYQDPGSLDDYEFDE